MQNSQVMLATRRAQFAYLQIALPGSSPMPAGVLLLDPEQDRLYLKLRQDWDEISPEEADVLRLLEDDLQAMADQLGGKATLEKLEDQLSHLLRITEREETLCGDFQARLRRLYREAIPGTVTRYVTHVPFFPVKAAAGYLSGEMTTDSASDWLPLPDGVRPSAELFAVQIEGRSMEPKIPDGSVALFRKIGAGSRQGKIVLVERFGHASNAGQYTVKVYSSQKRAAAGSAFDQDAPTWEHATVRMSPLNPAFESWDLAPDEFRVLGEFVCLLPDEE